jgi:hypothetical protein
MKNRTMKKATKKGIQNIIEKRSKKNDKISNLYSNKETLDYLSLLPQFISFLTGCIGVYYFVNRPNDLFLTVFFMAVCVIMLFACEVGIRNLTIRGVEKFFDGIKPVFTFCFVLILAFITCFNSYTCGSFIVNETSAPPTLSYSSKVDTLNKELVVIKAQIDQAISTTWKGRTTREATKMLNESLYPERDRLNKELSATKLEEKQIFESKLIEFNSRNTNYGIITGSIGVFCTLLSIIMLIFKEKYEHEIIEIIENETGKSLKRQGTDIGFDQIEQFFNNYPMNDKRFNRNDKHLSSGIGFLKSIGNNKMQSVKSETQTIYIDKSRQKKCLNCGSIFEYKNSSAKYCSSSCRTEFNNKKRKNND